MTASGLMVHCPVPDLIRSVWEARSGSASQSDADPAVRHALGSEGPLTRFTHPATWRIAATWTSRVAPLYRQKPPRLDVTDAYFTKSGDPQKTGESGQSVVYEYRNPEMHGCRMSVDHGGTLRFEIRARGDRVTLGGGRDMFVSGMRRLARDRVKVAQIQARWHAGNDSTNFLAYMANIASMSREEAAKNTWTGRIAAAYGFTVVKYVQQLKGLIRVLFAKP